MDQHAMLMERVGEGILQVAQAEEKRLDAQLQALENLGTVITTFRWLNLVIRLSVCCCR